VLVLSASTGWCSLVLVLMCPGIAVSARVVGAPGEQCLKPVDEREGRTFPVIE